MESFMGAPGVCLAVLSGFVPLYPTCESMVALGGLYRQAVSACR